MATGTKDPRRRLRLVKGHSEVPVVTPKKLFGMLTSTVKTCSLYPRGHVMYKKAMRRFWRHLDRYLQDHDSFHLEVDTQKGLLCEGEVIYKGDPQPGEFFFVLIRDGITELAIDSGVEPWEARELIKRSVQNLFLKENDEGDFVTSLWEAQLPHVRYHAVDVAWRDDDKEVWELEKTLTMCSAQTLGDIKRALSQTALAPPVASNLMELTPSEWMKLQEMIQEEDERESTEEVLDILLETLQGHINEEDLKPITRFLYAQFKEALESGEYGLALRILQRVYIFKRHCEDYKKGWALPLVEEFFRECSKRDTLKGIISSWPQDDPWQQDDLKRTLKMLPTEAFPNLVSLLLNSPSAQFERVVVDALAHMASMDMGRLEGLLRKADEPLAIKCIQVLRRVEGERATKVLLELVREGNLACRKEATKVLVVRGPWAIKELFPLIENENEEVRRVVLEGLGWRRSPAAEELLLDYLQERRFRARERDFLFDCFIALGRCGSDRSIPFLRRCLFHKKLNPLSKDPRRRASAMALIALGTNKSKEVLQEATRSRLPWIRRVVERVMEEVA